MEPLLFDRELSIVVSGEAGQGLQTLERMLLKFMKRAGFHVFVYSEVMSRIRGGNNSTEIRISSERVSAFVDRIDLFIPIGRDAMSRFHERISGDTLIAGDEKYIDPRFAAGHRVVPLPIARSAQEAGGPIYANIIVFGIICAVVGARREEAVSFSGERFSSRSEEEIARNADALTRGYEIARTDLAPAVSAAIPASAAVKEEMVLYGNESIGLGAVTGGCNFIASYPMSPSTAVLTFMARLADEFGIVVEQAEDEISAVNMAIGAWYAGGRAMVTTSGGGFALMVEGLSLCGCVESPLVVHLGQRPAPATGLPTRTEQGDLLMALYAGHGAFPRILLAPGSAEEGIEVTRHAFTMADKYQVPVIILTDQYFLESACNLPEPDAGPPDEQAYIVKTGPDYRRFSLTENGVSPRGIPGYGDGFISVTSDEHTEDGHITEDPLIRIGMVDKRLRKKTAMMMDALEPRLMGSGSYSTLVVCWGSTIKTAAEAMGKLNDKSIALLHIVQVHPLHPVTARYIGRAKRVLVVENSSAPQLSVILLNETGRAPDAEIRKYDGMPFSVEEVAERVGERLASWKDGAAS